LCYRLLLNYPFKRPFNGGPGLAGTRMSPFWILVELTMMEVVVTVGTVRRAKLQSNRHHQQTNTQCLKAGCPSCLPTNGVGAGHNSGKIKPDVSCCTNSTVECARPRYRLIFVNAVGNGMCGEGRLVSARHV